MVKVSQIVHKEPIIMGLHNLPYLETGMSDFGHYPCGGLFASYHLDLLIKRKRKSNMKDVKQFMETMTGKIVVMVAILVIGLFIGSKFSHKEEPIVQAPTQDEIANIEPTLIESMAVVETDVIQKNTMTQNKIVTGPEVAKIPVVSTPTPSNNVLRIDGLCAIRVSGGLQDNWDADVENDGPVLNVVYLDKNGDIISSDATEKMLITADVKLYAGSNSMSKNEKLVYTQHFNSDQIIFGSIYPKIRIPEEKISVNPSIDYKYGTSVITIHTPNQGDFSGTGILTVLYE